MDDDTSTSVLVEAKKEYTKHLINYLLNPLYDIA